MEIPTDATPEEPLSWAHPVVREWFTARFGTPTEPQIAGWPHLFADATPSPLRLCD
jgi:Lhr-like helicase